MDIRDLRESSSDSDEPSASSHSVHQLHSEDSRNSRDSYLLNNDDPMEEIRFDDWGNNESTEDDSRYESCMLINLDSSHDESLEILSHRVPPLLERIEDSPEENNNDPNNNMDSIESDSLEEAAGGSHDSATDRSRRREYQNVLNVDRAQSPQPGCSKDYQPVFVPTPDSSPIEDTMLNKKTRDILGLVQEIDFHSIFNALCKNDTIPVKELKLWDLIPEQSRCDFSEYLLTQEEAYPDNSVVVLENNSELACDTQIETQSTVTNNGAKRGPADDICTVQPKKSSSDTDLSISTEAAVSDNSSPGVSSSAEDPDSPTKPVNRGAIPKIRDQPAKKKSSTSYQAFHALLIDAQKSVPIADIYTRTVSPTYEKSQQKTISTTEEILVEQQKMKSLDANAKPPIFVAKAPFLKYRAPKFAISRPNNTESEKTKVPIHVQRQKETEYRSQQSLQKTAASTSNIVQPEKSKASSVGNTRYNLAPVPINVQKQKETVYRSQQSQEKSAASRTNITESEKSKASSVGDTRSRNEVENRLQQPLRLATKPMAASTPTSVAVGPNNQQRLTAIDKQLIRQATVMPKSVAASMPVTIEPKYQQRQMEMGNRLQQQPTSTIAPNHQLGIIRLEYANRSKQQTQQQTHKQIAAASIYHQMPMEMDNPFQQTATICHRMQTANLELPAQTQIPTPAPVKEQSTKRIICKEMYYKLRNIFPNVDRKYIKKLCPPDWGPGDKDAQMAPIIEHLLEAGETLPQEQPIVEIIDGATKNFTQDDLCEFFIGIFPDADPHYLRERALIHLGNDDGIKNFVDSHLEDRNYPTREQYRARLKITEQQRQYTTGFEVKQFLSIIPDPSKHFMDARRKCTHQTVAFEFLKSHFNKLRVTTISRMYTQNQYNLSLTAQSLEILHDELKSKRAGYEMPTADILLLQEIAFVKHKQEINKYIARLKKEEDDEFRTLKALNQLLECQCCYDSECVPSKSSECDNGHIFCNSCIVTGTSAKMGEDQTRIHCFVNCGSEFSLSVLQRVLAPTTFSILLKKRQAAEVIEAGLEGLVSCPFCHFASIPPEGDKIFKCLNPECTKESCRLCKELSHVPLKCDEVIKAEDARHYIEEKMTQALARKCYMCKRAFFKEEGCNKITCPCGAIMCYLCDQPIKDYTHFRGQGSNDRNLCPLYSDTIRLDAVAVCKVAEEAERELLKRNPNINIDTTRLRPDIPRARTGPHMDILNADELPRRAHRVLDLPPL